MKFTSLDLETTSLDSKHQILSFGAIIEDSKTKLPYESLPKFHCILLHDVLVGQPYAINMNKDIIALMLKYQLANSTEKMKISANENILFLHPDAVAGHFKRFLTDNGYEEGFDGKIKFIVAGKNVSFDLSFLEQLTSWNIYFSPSHRKIDPAILFTDWENDETIPNLDLCKQRGKIEGSVKHEALSDAWDIVQLLRTKY